MGIDKTCEKGVFACVDWHQCFNTWGRGTRCLDQVSARKGSNPWMSFSDKSHQGWAHQSWACHWGEWFTWLFFLENEQPSYLQQRFANAKPVWDRICYRAVHRDLNLWRSTGHPALGSATDPFLDILKFINILHEKKQFLLARTKLEVTQSATTKAKTGSSSVIKSTL